MKRFPHIPDREYAFGMIFNVSNQCQSVLDSQLAPYDITTKQWYLSVIVNALFTSPPQLSDVAKMMNTSHQNVKVIAEKLEKKGHLIFVSDESDQRKVRVKLTQQSVDFWQSLIPKSEEAMNQIFEGIKPEDLSLFCDTLTQLLDNLDRMKENGK